MGTTKFDPSAANTQAALQGAYKGESLDPRDYSGKITAQDWQVNSPYLQWQVKISSGPDDTQKLNVVVARGAAAIHTGRLFSVLAGVAVAGVPNKEEGKPAKMGYVCSRGSEHNDAALGYVGLPLTSAIEVCTTGFDSEATYAVDDLLYAEYKGGVFTGLFTNDTANTYDNVGGDAHVNCPIVGIVSPSFYSTTGTENVGDAESLGGAGFIGVPFIHIFPVFDIVRGEAESV